MIYNILSCSYSEVVKVTNCENCEVFWM